MTTVDTPASPTIETNPKWIRGLLGDQTIVDTTRSLYVWEHRYFPAWFFPPADIVAELRPATDPVERRRDRPGIVRYDLPVGDRIIPNGAHGYPDSDDPALAEMIAVDWSAMDQWFEEDTEVIVHPRSPYVRIDTLPSSRHVVVRVDGQVVADSVRPTLLFETGLPTRYYLPPDDVNFDLLTPTDLHTACPYKGAAHFWSVEIEGTVHENVVWSYDDPLPESRGIAGLLGFYNERVEIEIDDLVDPQPTTKSS